MADGEIPREAVGFATLSMVATGTALIFTLQW